MSPNHRHGVARWTGLTFLSFLLSLSLMSTSPSLRGHSAPAFPLPEFLGVYAVSGGKLVELREALEEGRYRLVRQSDGLLLAGVFPLSGISLEGQSFIIAYKRVRPVRYSIGVMEKSVINGVQLYVPFRDLRVRIAPVEGREGMARVVPAEPLLKGTYIFYLWTPVVNSFEGAVVLFRDTGTHAAWVYDFSVDTQRP